MSRRNEWVDIKKNASYKRCGVYKIRLADFKDYPIEISRFLDNDIDGILQIGSAEDTEKRIKCFRGAMKGKNNNCKIQYSFKKLQNESEARTEEERLLKCYFKRHREVPPLNNNLPKRYNIDWGSLNCD